MAPEKEGEGRMDQYTGLNALAGPHNPEYVGGVTGGVTVLTHLCDGGHRIGRVYMTMCWC